MTKIKSITYTKDNGEVSERDVIVVSAPRENYLCYDVSGLSKDERNVLIHYLNTIDEYIDETFAELTSITGVRREKLWRSFKPANIKWDRFDE